MCRARPLGQDVKGGEVRAGCALLGRVGVDEPRVALGLLKLDGKGGSPKNAAREAAAGEGQVFAVLAGSVFEDRVAGVLDFGASPGGDVSHNVSLGVAAGLRGVVKDEDRRAGCTD